MEKRNLLRQIPKKEVKPKEKKEEKTLDESEVFKTEKKHDLEVLPINEEPTEKKEPEPLKKEVVIKEVFVEREKEKKKRQIKREMCGCGKDYAINAHHFHLNTKQHKEWLKSQQKEEPEPVKKDVETKKMEIPVSKESETKKQEVVKPKQINQPFEIDYDRIIHGVSQNYINYKLQKQEHKKKQAPVDDYKTKYEKLLEQQEKDKKKHQANLYLYKQNQAFGRPKRGGGWFN